MMHHRELDLQRGGNFTEKGANMTRVLFGQIEICKAMRQRRVAQLHAVGPVHSRQDGCQILVHDGRKVVFSGR